MPFVFVFLKLILVSLAISLLVPMKSSHMPTVLNGWLVVWAKQKNETARKTLGNIIEFGKSMFFLSMSMVYWKEGVWSMEGPNHFINATNTYLFTVRAFLTIGSSNKGCLQFSQPQYNFSLCTKQPNKMLGLTGKWLCKPPHHIATVHPL